MTEPASPAESSAPAARAKLKRKYVLTARGARSQRALVARRANLAKARAAAREQLYRRTEKRLAASRANLAKAIAARKSPEGNRAARLNALRHGLYAKRVLPDSVLRLGEDPEDFLRFLAHFERTFLPEDDEERDLIRRLAGTVWRRLRLHPAQARRERERLRGIFALAPEAERLTAEETEARADALTFALYDSEAFFRDANSLQSQIEYLLRKLLRKRSGGQIEYGACSPRRDPEVEELLQPSWVEKLLRWQVVSPGIFGVSGTTKRQKKRG